MDGNDDPCHMTNDANLLESSELLGPDYPLPALTTASAFDSPPYDISSSDNTTFLTRTEREVHRTEKKHDVTMRTFTQCQ